MPFVDLDTVTVTGTLVKADGTAESGTVTFQLPQILFDRAGDQVITPTPCIARLDGTGSFSIVVPASDDPDVLGQDGVPASSSYVVTISVSGAQRAVFNNVLIPVSLSGMSIDLVTLLLGSAPASSSPTPGLTTFPSTTLYPGA